MDEWIRTDISSLRPLGNGGGGDVYHCELVGLDGFRQEAVVKLARPGDRLSEQGLKDEARLLARLRHPNIIQVRDYGRRVVDGHRTPFLLMDHGGVTLDQLRRSMGGRIEPWLATFIALEVCAGLEHAHARDILHRDIKPANVLIGYQGEVKLIDFGIAWAPNRLQETTQNAWVKGTHCYVPPERLRGEPADQRSDLWALGVMLYEMVDGRRPWVISDENLPEAQRHRELLEQVLENEPPELAPELIPETLADIIYDLLEKERVARFTSATEVIGRLQRIFPIAQWTARKELARQAQAAAGIRGVGHVAPPDAATRPIDAAAYPPVERVGPSPGPVSGGASGSSAALEASGAAERDSDVVFVPAMRTGWQRSMRRISRAGLVGVAVAAAAWFGVRSSAVPAEYTAPPSVASASAEETQAPSSSATVPEAEAPVGEALPAESDVSGTLAEASLPLAREEPPEPPPKAEPILQRRQALPPEGRRRQSRRSQAERRKAPETSELALLRVVVAPRGSYVSVDGMPPRRAPAVFEGLRPGRHTIQAGLGQDRLDKEQAVTLTSGDNSFHIELANPFGGGV